MAKRMIRYISVRDTETGQVISKGHYSLMAAGDKAKARAKKTGRSTDVWDEYGKYLTYPGTASNPVPRNKWISGKVMITRSGQVKFKKGR